MAAALCTPAVAAGVNAAESGALMHGPTFMGNPLAAAVANAPLSLLVDGRWRRRDPHRDPADGRSRPGAISPVSPTSGCWAHRCHRDVRARRHGDRTTRSSTMACGSGRSVVWSTRCRPTSRPAPTSTPITTRDAPWPRRCRDRLRDMGRRGLRRVRAAGPGGAHVRRPRARLRHSTAPRSSRSFNDYLGLSTHPEVVRAAHAALDQWGAAPLRAVSSSATDPCTRTWSASSHPGRAPRPLLFPTGFATNLGVPHHARRSGLLIVSDELNHAPIIDGAG
ncbi:MAG: hypothetical protein R2695_10335 [Acidimicrobiales bacterium]